MPGMSPVSVIPLPRTSALIVMLMAHSPGSRLCERARTSRSICAFIGQAGVVKLTVSATVPSPILISLIIPRSTRSRPRSGSLTPFSASMTARSESGVLDLPNIKVDPLWRSSQFRKVATSHFAQFAAGPAKSIAASGWPRAVLEETRKARGLHLARGPAHSPRSEVRGCRRGRAHQGPREHKIEGQQTTRELCSRVDQHHGASDPGKNGVEVCR